MIGSCTCLGWSQTPGIRLSELGMHFVFRKAAPNDAIRCEALVGDSWGTGHCVVFFHVSCGFLFRLGAVLVIYIYIYINIICN